MENEGILYVFPIFQTADWGQKIRRSAADDLFRVSSENIFGGDNVNAGSGRVGQEHVTDVDRGLGRYAL